jgi:hypothetical protein
LASAASPGGALHLTGDLAFGPVEVNTRVRRALRIVNEAGVPVTITSLLLPPGFSTEAVWPASLAASNVYYPSYSREIDVWFSPTELRSYTGSLIVRCDRPDPPAALPIGGRGTVASRVAEIAGPVDFGRVQLGRAARRLISVRNVGASAIPLSGLAFPEGFYASLGRTNLEWGQSMLISVSFTPRTARDYSGALELEAPWTAGSGTVPLAARGVAATGTITIPADQPTIAAGIDAAIKGDTLRLLPGTYAESVVMDKENLRLVSLFEESGDPAYIGDTVLAGDGQMPVVRLAASATVRGLTLSNGSWGIDCRAITPGTASAFMPTTLGRTCDLRDNRVLRNRVGGVLLGAIGETGSGLVWSSSGAMLTATLSNNIIQDNSGPGLRTVATGYTGKVTRRATLDCTVLKSVLADNQCGLDAWSSEAGYGRLVVRLGGSTLYANGPEPIRLSGASSSLTLANVIVWNGAPYSVAVVSGATLEAACSLVGQPNQVWPGRGNLYADPRFMSAATGRFGLRSDSPCIDAGTQPGSMPAMPFLGRAPDIGASEFDPARPPVFIEGVANARGAIRLTVDSDPARTYTLMSAETLTEPLWREVVSLSGTGAPLALEDPLPPRRSQRFYRVQAK